MILLIGQVGRDMSDREAFQEIDYRRMFGPLAKWAAQIDVTARIPEYMARAFHVATSGRPGPVVLALPEDMLSDHAVVADAAPYLRVGAEASSRQVAALGELLAGAERPLLLWPPLVLARSPLASLTPLLTLRLAEQMLLCSRLRQRAACVVFWVLHPVVPSVSRKLATLPQHQEALRGSLTHPAAASGRAGINGGCSCPVHCRWSMPITCLH